MKLKDGDRMKKVSILALHLGYGGVEKVITNVANMLSENYKVEIFVTYKMYEKPIFKLNENIEVKYLINDLKPNRNELKTALKEVKLKQIITECIKSIKILYLRKKTMKTAIKNCDSDIIISTRILYNSLLSQYGSSKSIKIAQEHKYHNNKKRYIKRLIKSCYNIDYFMAASKYLTIYYSKLFKTQKSKCIYIPHNLDNIPKQISNLKEEKLITIGRLSKEKGFCDLIEVFSLVNKKYPKWELHIIGDGAEKNNIINIIKQKQLENKVILHGYQDDVNKNRFLKNSSIYIMTSFEESFGLVLLEAASYGLPAVVFDSALGAHEIIDDKKSGFLIKNRNQSEMARKIIALIEDEKSRKEMGQKARKVSLNYSTNIVKKQWLEFFSKILGGEENA